MEVKQDHVCQQWLKVHLRFEVLNECWKVREEYWLNINYWIVQIPGYNSQCAGSLQTHSHTRNFTLCCLDSSCACLQHSFQFFVCRYLSFPLPSGQRRVSKDISRIKSVLSTVMPGSTWLSRHQGAKLKQSKSKETHRCEARRWRKCPLFLRSTRGRWTLITSLRLIFRPLSSFSQTHCGLTELAMKTVEKQMIATKKTPIKTTEHHTIKRNLMVFGQKTSPPKLTLLTRSDSNHGLTDCWTVSQKGERIT